MYCKDCKYWAHFDGIVNSPSYEWITGFGECQCEKFVDVNIYHDYSAKVRGIVPSNDMLVSWDAESYAAGCYVGEEFGCIHFEAGQYERPVVSEDEIDAFIEGAKSY